MLEVQAGLDGQDLTGRERATQVASFAGTGAVVDVETHHVPRRAQRPAPVQAAVRLQRLLRGDRKNAEVLKSRGENLGARTMVGAEAGALGPRLELAELDAARLHALVQLLHLDGRGQREEPVWDRYFEDVAAVVPAGVEAGNIDVFGLVEPEQNRFRFGRPF